MASRQSNSDQLETILYRLDEIEKKIDRMGNVETRIALLEKEQIVQGIEIKGLVGDRRWIVVTILSAVLLALLSVVINNPLKAL